MRATFKSLPEDPTELRAVSELMAAEIKAQAYQIEKLKKELAGHRKARFGSKSETMGTILNFLLWRDNYSERRPTYEHRQRPFGPADGRPVARRSVWQDGHTF